MADATTIKGGRVKILLGVPGAEPGDPIVYTAPCGFLSKSVTINKGLEEQQGVSCDEPDAISWMLRDGVSLSMSVSGEGLLAAESLETWLDALEDPDSTPAKVEIELPAKTITYTGNLHVETFSFDAPNKRRVTSNVSLQSDGEMVRTSA